MYVTVDDDGYSQSVNALIERGITAGVLDASAILVNRPGSEAALKRARTDRRIAYGLHLNLTEGAPLLAVSKVGSLVDEHGKFLGWPGLITRLLTGQVRRAELLAEADTQFAAFTAVRPLDFWNAHHHLHLFPGLFQPLATLGTRHGAHKVRLPRRVWAGTLGLEHTLKGLIIQGMGALTPARRLSVVAPVLTDLDWVRQNPANWAQFFARVPTDAELICHPHPIPSTLEWLIEHRHV